MHSNAAFVAGILRSSSTSFHGKSYLIIFDNPVLAFVSSQMIRNISRASVTPDKIERTFLLRSRCLTESYIHFRRMQHFGESNTSISKQESITNIINNYFINIRKAFNIKKQFRAGTGTAIHERYLEVVLKDLQRNLVFAKHKTYIQINHRQSAGSILANTLRLFLDAYLRHLQNITFPKELKDYEMTSLHMKLIH